jgi:hypothetical protein
VRVRSIVALLPWSACVAMWGCATADLGKSPEFLWWTDHESGDLSGWTGDDGGYVWTSEGGTVEVVTNPTRSGRYALRSAVVASSSATKPSSGLVSRNGSLPTEAYYSAWFYVPEAVIPTQYWLFFKFRSRSTESTTSTAVELWDLDLMSDGASGLTLRLYHHDTGDETALATPTVPLGRWFQTEAFYRAANDASGRLTVWVDGVNLFDVTGKPTAPTPYVEWGVGGAADAITPPSATLYIDDAAITTERLGPDFPVFWRGE